MELYILRHAIAEERRPGLSDAKRELTAEGIKKLRRVLRRAGKVGVQPEIILSSPLVRAQHTAQIARELLRCEQPVLTAKVLLPEAKVADTWAEIRKHASVQSLLIAGHEPHLGRFLSALLGSTRAVAELKKSSLAHLHVNRLSAAPQGVLEWLITSGTAR